MVCSTALVSAQPQGFFGGFRNFFGGGGPQAPRGGRGGGGCGASGPNHNFEGRSYLVSWRAGCTSFTHGEGAAFCRGVGMRPVSLDTPAKEREFTAFDHREYIL